MANLLRNFNNSVSIFAKPTKAHQYAVQGSYKEPNRLSLRPGAHDNEKYPSIINGKETKYRQS